MSEKWRLNLAAIMYQEINYDTEEEKAALEAMLKINNWNTEEMILNEKGDECIADIRSKMTWFQKLKSIFGLDPW